MGKVSINNTYYTKVQVGRDIVEAEYLEFNHDTGLDLDFTLWDKITIPFYRMKRKIANIRRKIRYGFQRMFKGYDDVDTFDTFYKFIERYQKILSEYKKCKHGYPCGTSEEEWDSIIDEMIYHLYYMDEENVVKELSKDVSENWSPSLKTAGEIMNKHKNEFFKLFSEYFFSLWD